MPDISQKLIARLGANLEGYKKGLRSAVSEARTAGSKMRANFARAAQGARTLAKGVGLVAIALTGIGILAVREFVQWEEALTGVAKTVDATEAEIRALGATFVDLSEKIPVSAVALAKLGEVAGQLGVQLPDIKEFVEVAAALGVSTNLMAEEAATGLARFSNVMGTVISDVDRLGSTIVDLGNNMATTEREILEMSLRLTGVGKQVGLSEAQVLSFSAALSSLGIRSEAGGSAFSRVFAEIASEVASGGDRLKEFARVADQTVEDFQRSFKDDAAEAVIAFIAGLDRLGKEGENVFGILEKVEFQDIRVRDSLLRAAGGVDLLRRSMEIGNRAWEENTALTNEAARFYDRVGARLVALRNKLSNVAAEFGEALTPVIETATTTVAGFLDRIREAAPAVATFAEKAAQSIPVMVEKIVNGIGSIGLKLLAVIEFFRDNPLAGGLGLVGLVFLGPQGAAALGAIGFVIDSLIDKLGGPQTVAEAMNEKLRTQIDLQAELLRKARLMDRIGFAQEIAGGKTPAELREEAEFLGRSIAGIRLSIQNLGSEDFVALGEEGSAAFSVLTEGARSFFEEMANFQTQIAGGGEDEGGGIKAVIAGASEEIDTMRFKFEPLPLLVGEMTAKLQTGKAVLNDWGNAATNIANTMSSGIGGALGDMLTGVKGVGQAMVQLGKTILRSVVSALTQAVLQAGILRAVLSAFGLPLPVPVPSFATGGIVPGSPGTAVPAILHGGEVVLNAATVKALGGTAVANNLNAPAQQPANISLTVDASNMPPASDFGIIATNPQLVRFVSEVMRQVEFVRT